MEGLQKTDNRAIFLFQNFKLKQKTDADFYIRIKDISCMKSIDISLRLSSIFTREGGIII